MAYTYAAKVVTLGAMGVAVQALGGNPSRVTLVVASSTVTQCSLQFDGSAGNNTAFCIPQLVGLNALPYRDWGPLITGEIWLGNPFGAAGQVNVIEIYRI